MGACTPDARSPFEVKSALSLQGSRSKIDSALCPRFFARKLKQISTCYGPLLLYGAAWFLRAASAKSDQTYLAVRESFSFGSFYTEMLKHQVRIHVGFVFVSLRFGQAVSTSTVLGPSNADTLF